MRFSLSLPISQHRRRRTLLPKYNAQLASQLVYRDVGAFSKVGPRLVQLRFGVSTPKNQQKINKNPPRCENKNVKFQGRFELDEAVSEFS